MSSIGDRLDRDVTGRSQVQIAAEAGYPNPSMLSMLKSGEQRLPLNRILPLAKALRADPYVVFGLALEQHMGPEEAADLQVLFCMPKSRKQALLIRRVLEILEEDDPPTLTKELDEALRLLLKGKL